MPDLVTFIRARLDHDEQVARAAAEAATSPNWRDSDSGIYPADNPGNHPGPFLSASDDYIDPEISRHITLHDPARVLREVAAKRRILAAHQVDADYCTTCSVEVNDGYDRAPVAAPCPTLLDLASVWSEHPDYDQAWATLDA